jgi:hypothetical protein
MIKPTYYVVGAALALAAIGAAWQQTTINGLRLELAEARTDRSEEIAAGERAARQHAEHISQLKTAHAVEQQERENVFAQAQQVLERTRAADRARAVSLRQQLEAATAASSRPRDHTDPVACEHDRDRLDSLGRLAGEGLELLEEGRGLLNHREAQLRHVIGQVLLDRQALREAATSPSPGHAP